MDAHGLGLTLKTIRVVAQDVASKYGIRLKFSWKWLSGLYRCHPESSNTYGRVAEYFNVLESFYRICCEGRELVAIC